MRLYLFVFCTLPVLFLFYFCSVRSLGLLGGYCYYHNETTSKLFSLQRGVVAGLHTADVFGGEDRGYFEGWLPLRDERIFRR